MAVSHQPKRFKSLWLTLVGFDVHLEGVCALVLEGERSGKKESNDLFVEFKGKPTILWGPGPLNSDTCCWLLGQTTALAPNENLPSAPPQEVSNSWWLELGDYH